MLKKRRMRQLKKELKNKIISVNEIIKTSEWSAVFVKTTYEEPFIELLNNFCKDLKELEEILEEKEENKKLLDEYEQIACERKDTLKRVPIQLENLKKIQKDYPQADTLPKDIETYTLGLMIANDYYNDIILDERKKTQDNLYVINSKLRLLSLFDLLLLEHQPVLQVQVLL